MSVDFSVALPAFSLDCVDCADCVPAVAAIDTSPFGSLTPQSTRAITLATAPSWVNSASVADRDGRVLADRDDDLRRVAHQRRPDRDALGRPQRQAVHGRARSAAEIGCQQRPVLQVLLQLQGGEVAGLTYATRADPPTSATRPAAEIRLSMLTVPA